MKKIWKTIRDFFRDIFIQSDSYIPCDHCSKKNSCKESTCDKLEDVELQILEKMYGKKG